jgi:predicted permease
MMGFAQDLQFAARQFRRSPGYALFTVLVLVLGIGTVTAMFTIVYAVLLKPLPFEADRRLFQSVEKTSEGDDTLSISYDEIRQWREAARGRAEIAFNGGGLNIADGPAGALLITEVKASENLFSLLGARPILGRGFSPGEAEAGNSDAVVLSYALWQQSFAGDPNVLGKRLHIGGASRTVVGVMPPHFIYPVWEERPQAWVPVDHSELAASNSDAYSSFSPLVRTSAGVPASALEAQLARVHAQFAKSDQNKIRLQGLRDLLVANVRPALLALGMAVAVVWLIACSNVAGLMLARITARRTEIAVRAALGAARRRIVMQQLTESLVLSILGAAGGLALAWTMLRMFRHLLTAKLPLAETIHLDWTVWICLVALTLLTTLIFGAAPALIATRTDLRSDLTSSGRKETTDRGRSRARAVLLIGQVALSVALLIAAGLMMRTMYALRHVPLGFRTDHLVLTSLTIPNDLYGDRNVGATVWQPLLEDIRRMPGVRAAALSTVLPIQHPVELLTAIYATQWMRGDASAVVRAATPGLMEALGVRMRSGRFFTDADTATSLPVIVVNQAFVNRYLGGSNALGKVIKFGHVPRAATVIGVIEDVHQDSVAEASQPEFYLSVSQVGPDQQIYKALLGRFMQVAVRAGIAPDAMIPELRRTIRDANPQLAVGECTTMSEAVEDSIGAQNLAAQVIGVFGALVLLITVVGLYGLLNYLVVQRTREIGIRMALGADRRRVVSAIMRRTLALLAVGTVAGLGLSFACRRLLQSFLFGVSTLDPSTIALTLLALLACGLLAAALPAHKAASVNPVDALRAE